MESFLKILKDLSLDTDMEDKVYTNFLKNKEYIESIGDKIYKEDLDLDSIDELDRLTAMVYKLIGLKNNYLKKNIPEEIFIDSIDDLKLWADEYYKEYNKYGLSESNIRWLQHLYKMDLFKLHNLQFQKRGMYYLTERDGKKYMDFDSNYYEILAEATPVIAVHIQKGADFSEESVDRSFEKAEKFFKQYYSEHKYKAYICYSWFLYEGNKNIMDKNSNIMKFADRFKIIGSVDDNKQGIERIYGRQYDDLKDYPVDTSLQRNALGKFDNLGYACGIILV